MTGIPGFAISWRSKWDHPIFRRKQEAAVWAWMCDTAQWQDYRMPTKFGPIDLKRGELVISEREVADDFGLHRNTLRALIQRMVDDGMITLIRDRIHHRAGTIVSIVKYEQYQQFAPSSADSQDRSGTEPRTEAGPKEDRSGTKNNTDNTYNKDKDVSQPTAEATVSSHFQAMSVVGSADVCVLPGQCSAAVSTAATGSQGGLPFGLPELPVTQTPAKPKSASAKKPSKFAPWMSETWSRFKAEYPSRGVTNPNVAGREAFALLLLNGVDAEDLISAAKAYNCQMARSKTTGTRGVMHYTTFFNKDDGEFWKQVLAEESANVHHNVHPLRPGQNINGFDQQPRKPKLAGVVG